MDKYQSFAELSKKEKEGIDFRIEQRIPASSVAFIAPHGGAIEFMTSEVANALAGKEYRYYSFKGIKKNGNGDLHITSTNFDEPSCFDVIEDCESVIAIHGLSDDSSKNEIDVGGRNGDLRNAVAHALVAAEFDAKIVTSGSHAAISVENICNRGHKSGGVQLELTAALRLRMRDNPRLLGKLVATIRSVVS